MISYICPPIAVRILDNGVRVDLATGLGVLVPVPSGPPGRQGPKGDTGAGVPPGGAAGQYLRKASAEEDDCEWGDLPAPPVLSVNGKTGAVGLDAEDVGALPDTTPLFSGDYDDLTNKPAIPTKVSDLQNDSGFVNTAEAAAAAPVQSVNGQTGAVVLFESGTDGTWSWKKWSDGLLELQRFYNGPPTTGTHYTTVNGFYGYYVHGFTFPSDAQPIDAYYSIMADWAIGSGFSIFAGTVSSKAVTGFSLYALSTSASQSVVRIGIYIRAKWK